MNQNEIELDGDPRNLARAILRAAKQTYRQKNGDLDDTLRLQSELQSCIPELARHMVEALERDTRDVYLTNALEIMALTYAKKELRRHGGGQ